MTDRYDAVIVGAGFAGLYMLHQLREMGFKVRVYEAASGVGGTWFWNRYPGARCDVESMEYSYGFSKELEQEWHWTERYATQPEILRYINHVADRFNLRPDIELNTRVFRATYRDRDWTVETEGGAKVETQFFIMATGCLSVPNMPDVKGLETFAGEWYHTGQWPQQPVDFRGKRVAVIGTGSSGIQAIPLIAKDAEHLYVFQRTPNYSIPAHNGPLSKVAEAAVKRDYETYRRSGRESPFGLRTRLNDRSAMDTPPAERERLYQEYWDYGGLGFLGSFSDLIFNLESNKTAGEFVRQKIRSIVKDPAVAEMLCPETVMVCKRLCVDTDYFETYNRDNVTLIDVKQSQIEAITVSGLRTTAKEYALDIIVFATGFDAMTGAMFRVAIEGKDGISLRDKWSEGALTYLGLASAGFPNFFFITGPGSPSVLSNMLPSIEQHVRWIGDCIAYVRGHDLQSIEATEQAERDWVAHVNEVADATLFRSCNSWYLGANVPGKPRVFTPYIGVPPYDRKCEEVAAGEYMGFELQ